MSNLLFPFQTNNGAVRGRFVRLTSVLDEILGQQTYPPVVALLLAETLGLTTVLAASLKYDGIFTLQVKGDGPVSLLVVDVTSEGHLRGYARFNPEADLASLTSVDLLALLGKGVLSFTVDQGPNTRRYQGIVELCGPTLAECVNHYFVQSQQLDTNVVVASSAPGIEGDGAWCASALMIQRMPGDQPGAPILTAESALESWRTAVILQGSITRDELLDSNLAPERLLHRLFHAEALLVWEPKALIAQCRCSEAKVSDALSSLPPEEMASLRDESGQLSVVCEFCGAQYLFDGEGKPL